MSSDVPAVYPGLGRLRQLSEARPRRVPAVQCELCSAGIPTGHGHVVNIPQRAIQCVCRPCYLLFAHDAVSGGRFKAVPDRYVELRELGIDDVWNALQIPVGVAFFLFSSPLNRVVALYPSPAGATESELPLDAWSALVAAAPQLAAMSADVEALLVRRGTPGFHADSHERQTAAFIVPIDVCYELIGRLRQEWRGFQGGEQVWRELDRTFARIAERARGSGS